MQVAGLGAEALFNVNEEGEDVVLGLLFDGGDARRIEGGLSRTRCRRVEVVPAGMGLSAAASSASQAASSTSSMVCSLRASLHSAASLGRVYRAIMSSSPCGEEGTR